MAKTVLIGVVIFYLLGVFGVGGGYLTENWADDWGTGDQFIDALRIGFSWPVVIVDLFADT
jgi:hypothetical protein